MQNNNLTLFLLSNLNEKKSISEILILCEKTNFKKSRSSICREIKKLVKKNRLEITFVRDLHPKRYPVKYYKTINN